MIARITAIAAFLLTSCNAWAQAPHEIPKSKATPDFVTAVSRFGRELSDWRMHMAKVAEDQKNHVPKDKAYQAFPAPTADPDIAASVDANGKPNYVVVSDDDTVLAAKKLNLLQRLSKAMQDASGTVFPLAKRPLALLREADIQQKDSQRFSTIAAGHKGVLAKLGIGTKTTDQIIDDVAKQRPTEDTEFLQRQADRRAKLEAIERASAQIMSDIDDLTISNIDTYVIPSLPN